MEKDNKMTKARARLILEQPFYATIALHLKYVEDYSIKTAEVNGRKMTYNPDFIEELTVEQVTGVIAHVIMHLTLFHHTRRNNREKIKWNQACDYAINPMLLDAKFTIPSDALIDPSFKNKSAEEIYSLLPEPAPSDYEPGPGEVDDPPPDIDHKDAEEDLKDVIIQAAMFAKRQGKLPAEMERLIDKELEPKISWQEILARFITEQCKNDYSWQKPAVRFLYGGVYLPSLENEEPGRLILLVDTSMSIDQELINQFGGEAQDIASTFKIPLTVIYIDTRVQSVQHIEQDEQVQLIPKGGGGTDFRPGFEYIEENDLQPKAVIYLTDGECDDFPEHPDYPVLWAQFGTYSSFNPPFGEVVQVK